MGFFLMGRPTLHVKFQEGFPKYQAGYLPYCQNLGSFLENYIENVSIRLGLHFKASLCGKICIYSSFRTCYYRKNNARFQMDSKYCKGRHINTIRGEKKKRRSGLSTLKRKMVGKKNWRTTRATSRSTSRPRRWCWCLLYWSTTRFSSPCVTSKSRRN